MIESCEVAAAITCSASHFGGFIGHSVTYAATLRGCVFSGSLSGGTYVATFNGWSDDGAATTLIDCLDASESRQPIGRGEGTVCVSNTYYFATKNFSNGERLWSEDKRGKRAWSVTPGEGVTIGFGAPVATYAASGIAAYATGLAYRGSDTLVAPESAVAVYCDPPRVPSLAAAQQRGPPTVGRAVPGVPRGRGATCCARLTGKAAFQAAAVSPKNLAIPPCASAYGLLHYCQHTLVSLWVLAYAQISGVFLFYEHRLYKTGLNRRGATAAS